MDIILALMVFLYPLGMPFITLGSYIAVLILARSSAAHMLSLGLPVTLLLTVALSPAITRNGAGSFALPWWLQSESADYYVIEYALLCVSILVLFCFGAWAYRRFVPLRPLASEGIASKHASENTSAIAQAIGAFQKGVPISQSCVACGSSLTLKALPKSSEQQLVLQVRCRCGQCNGTFTI
jgi:hypothetical protein